MFRLLALAGYGIDDRRAGPGGQPLQVAALPFQEGGGTTRLLLITSRSSGRWIIPKGWPVRGLSFAESAAREAYEEAGVRGVMGAELGRMPSSRDAAGNEAPGARPIVVHALRVTKLLARWPERDQRRRRWTSRDEALAMITSPDLAAIIGAFEPGAHR